MNMNLLLHAPNTACDLSRYYKQAFKNAVELFVVTAYLTDWDASLELKSQMPELSRNRGQGLWHHQEGSLRKGDAVVTA
jgi:hypothetical protein